MKSISFSLIIFCFSFQITILNAQCWQSIAAGAGHSIALRTDGTLWAWGDNELGQLGIGSYQSKKTPTRIGTANNWQSVSSGFFHTMAIKTDGSLWAWGMNVFGQLGDSTLTDKNVPTRIGTATNWRSVTTSLFTTTAIKTDGSLWTWGGGGVVPQRIGTDNNWQSVSSGYVHTLALKSNGTLWAWGGNSSGQLGTGTNIETDKPIQIGTANNWQSIGAGYLHSLAIKSDGTLWAWGDNSLSQLGDSTTNSKSIPTKIGTDNNWKTTMGGFIHSIAIKTNGTLWGWGGNLAYQLSDSVNVFSRLIPTRIGTATNWQSLSVGYFHTLGIKTDATLWAWGANDEGQLGDGTFNNRAAILSISCAVTGVKDIKPVYFALYPNPVHQELVLETADTEGSIEYLQIINLAGQILLQKEINDKQAHIDVSFLTNGLFILKIKTNDGKETIRKFVKN